MGLIALDVVFTHLFSGAGFIAGEGAGLVTVNGAPGAREVEVRERLTGFVVRRVRSDASGAYVVHGLSLADMFDVIGRDYAQTYNDVIVARVRAWPYNVLSVTGAFTVNDTDRTLDGGLPIYGGEANSVAVTSGTAPAGITFAVGDASPPDVPSVGLYVLASGTATPGSYTWTLTVTAANGSSQSIACSATFT